MTRSSDSLITFVRYKDNCRYISVPILSFYILLNDYLNKYYTFFENLISQCLKSLFFFHLSAYDTNAGIIDSRS